MGRAHLATERAPAKPDGSFNGRECAREFQLVVLTLRRTGIENGA